MKKEFKKYHAYLLHYGDDEMEVGKFAKLSKALVEARCAMREHGIAYWDWVVDTYAEDGTWISRRSSIGGFEPMT